MSCRRVTVAEFGLIGMVLLADAPVHDFVRRVRWLFTLANANARCFAAHYPQAEASEPLTLPAIAHACLDSAPDRVATVEAMNAVIYNCRDLTDAEERILERVRATFWAMVTKLRTCTPCSSSRWFTETPVLASGFMMS